MGLLAVSDEVWLKIVSTVGAIVSTILMAVLPIVVIWLRRILKVATDAIVESGKQTTEAVKASSEASKERATVVAAKTAEVKEELVKTTTVADKKIDALAKVLDATHLLVDSALAPKKERQ